MRILILLMTGLAVIFSCAQADDSYREQRDRMIAAIEEEVRETAEEINKRSFSKRVMGAMRSVPRHLFVPKKQRSRAYRNRPLPIGYGQTISQPYIVALMTDLLQPEKHHRILEIGTGSGYQAAILSPLVADVYTIEIIEPLGESAARRLSSEGYDNVSTRIADGYDGWHEEQPFDGIIVTAAISHIPPPLVRQLKNGGRMVIPVGSPFQKQQLTLVEKDMVGKVTTRQVIPVIFVPFTGGHR